MSAGVPCPACGHPGSATTDTRPCRLGDLPCVRRRRTCARCGARFVTYEISQAVIVEVERALAQRAALLKSLESVR
jgi:transcriptional regulator NrdR family protein